MDTVIPYTKDCLSEHKSISHQRYCSYVLPLLSLFHGHWCLMVVKKSCLLLAAQPSHLMMLLTRLCFEHLIVFRFHRPDLDRTAEWCSLISLPMCRTSICHWLWNWSPWLHWYYFSIVQGRFTLKIIFIQPRQGWFPIFFKWLLLL